MPTLPDEIKNQVIEAFADLKSPVRLVIFTQTLECMYCRENRQLLEEIAELSDWITTEVYNLIVDAEKAQEYGVDKIPAVAILGEQDYGIRFYGIPAGYEFTTLVHTIRMVGGVGSQLDDKTREQLSLLVEPVHMMVFVTPTCPYCPQAVAAAFEMAYASPLVRVDGIESSEFPHLAIKHQVAGVPRTIINEKVDIEGAMPPDMLLEKIQEALASQAEEKE